MATLRCPICRKLFESERAPTTPFCSPRCREIDLKRWLGEEYGLPRISEDEPEEADPPRDDNDEAAESGQ